MTKPLAMVAYGNILLGSQLVNRLYDLGYRVSSTVDLSNVATLAAKERPILLIMDLSASQNGNPLHVIQSIRSTETTTHLPILAVTQKNDPSFHAKASEAGTTLIALNSAIIAQLPQLLEQVLSLE
jgi:PleD family two-component response regulator